MTSTAPPRLASEGIVGTAEEAPAVRLSAVILDDVQEWPGNDTRPPVDVLEAVKAAVEFFQRTEPTFRLPSPSPDSEPPAHAEIRRMMGTVPNPGPSTSKQALSPTKYDDVPRHMGVTRVGDFDVKKATIADLEHWVKDSGGYSALAMDAQLELDRRALNRAQRRALAAQRRSRR